jgi:hypothetical protein
VIPDQLRSGDSWQWDDDAPALPYDPTTFAPSDTYTQSYAFQGPANFLLSSVAAPSGTGYRTTSLPAATGALEPGIYKYDRYVTTGSDRYTVASGRVEILENLQVQEGSFDARTFARKALDTIEATIQGNLDKPMLTQEGAATKIGYRNWADMMAVRSQLRLEVKSEEQADDLAKGLPSGRFIRLRMVSVR